MYSFSYLAKHIVGIRNKDRLLLHRNGFAVMLVTLSFILDDFSPCVLFARTVVIVWGSMRMFVTLVNPTSKHSTKTFVGSL